MQLYYKMISVLKLKLDGQIKEVTKLAKNLVIKPAKKLLLERPAKLLVYGDSGTGKTLSSLLIAKHLVQPDAHIIVEDNESNTSALYSKPEYGIDFLIAENEAPYNIKELPGRIAEPGPATERPKRQRPHPCALHQPACHYIQKLLKVKPDRIVPAISER